jgi:hypothetical protein
MQSLAKADAHPSLSKRVTEIHLSIKQLKGLQKDRKFQWGFVGNEVAGFLAKQVQQSAKHLLVNCHCNLSNSIERNIQVDLSRYYSKSQHKPWNKMVRNINTIPDVRK